MKDLNQAGEKEKASHLMEKTAWKNALAKAEGQKIKDDPLLLKKSVKKLVSHKYAYYICALVHVKIQCSTIFS